MKTFTKQQIITYFVLFILLTDRISVDVLQFLYLAFVKMGTVPAWFDAAKAIFPAMNAFYTFGAFGLIAIAIIMNKDDVQSLNIDKFYIFIFLYSGLVIFLEHVRGLGWLTGTALFLFSLYLFLKNEEMNFPARSPQVERISIFVIGTFVVCFIVVNDFLDLPKISESMHLFFVATIPDLVYEEVIFRGMLWMFLKNLGWTEPKIFFAQTFLFWLAHIRYLLSNPFNFWIFVPLASLLLGYIVLRFKSITPSTIAHMLLNLFYGSLIISL